MGKNAPEKLILVGKITKAHGIKGQVKIHSFTERPDTIGRFTTLFSADKTKQYHITAHSCTQHTVIASIAGIVDRNQAEQLRNTELYVSRDMLPELEQDEYYHEDLLGFTALDHQNNVAGTVSAFYNHGAGDLIEITATNGKDTMLLPFTKQAVPDIDLQKGTVIITPPETETIEDKNNG